MTDFVTGCTHFGHANIIGLANRPFENVTQMDQTLIANWNNTVRPQDTVYHLGDFAYRAAADVERAYISKLNGRIVRLQGNHDPEGWGVDYMSVKCNSTRVVLFHYPIEEWDGWWRGAVHLHCHTHKPDFVFGNATRKRRCRRDGLQADKA